MKKLVVPVLRLSLATVLTGAEALCEVRFQAYLKASNSGPNDQLGGGGIALCGDTLVIGTPFEDSSAKGIDADQGDGLDPTPKNRLAGFDAGAAYVFHRHGSGWSQQAYLKSADTASNDRFGCSVAVSGDSVVVGATGAKRRTEDGEFLGAAYVFVRDGAVWSQQARLAVPASSLGPAFGRSVATDGDTIVVGAPGEGWLAGTATAEERSAHFVQSGAAYVFVRDGTGWSCAARLLGLRPSPGNAFGSAVAVSGDTLVVAAEGERTEREGSSEVLDGAVHVFRRKGGKWTREAHLTAEDASGSTRFGSSVAISDGLVAVGAAGEGGSSAGKGRRPVRGSGAVHVFAREGGKWNRQAVLKVVELGPGAEFGCAVGLGGDRLLVGASDADHPQGGGTGVGAAFLFRRSGGAWGQVERVVAPNAQAADGFGGAVALSGTTLAVAAAGEDSVARGVNGDQGDDIAGYDAGAAYLFLSGGLPDAAPVAAGDGPEEQMFGCWTTDWTAMEKGMRQVAEGLSGLMLGHPSDEERAAAQAEALKEMKQCFELMTVEVRKGEITQRGPSAIGAVEQSTYRIRSVEGPEKYLVLDVFPPGGQARRTTAIVEGDRLILTRIDEEEMPLVLRRIDRKTFEEIGRACEKFGDAAADPGKEIPPPAGVPAGK